MPKSVPPSHSAGQFESDSIVDTLIEHQRPLTIALVLVAASVGGWWLWSRSAEIREERATEAYVSAEAAYTSGNKPLAQTEFEKIVVRFSGTSSGTQSAMLLAQLLFDQSRYDEGIAVLEPAFRKAPRAMRPGIQALIAGGQEGAGRPAEAAAGFARAADMTPFRSERDQFRMEQARNLASAGDRPGAEIVYRDLVGREDSPMNAEARLRLGELLAAPE